MSFISIRRPSDLDLQLAMQSVAITTNVASSIQHYVIKFVKDLRQWFSPVSSTNETNGHDITEIYLKVVFNHNPFLLNTTTSKAGHSLTAFHLYFVYLIPVFNQLVTIYMTNSGSPFTGMIT